MILANPNLIPGMGKGTGINDSSVKIINANAFSNAINVSLFVFIRILLLLGNCVQIGITAG